MPHCHSTDLDKRLLHLPAARDFGKISITTPSYVIMIIFEIWEYTVTYTFSTQPPRLLLPSFGTLRLHLLASLGQLPFLKYNSAKQNEVLWELIEDQYIS